jgi:predicted  nucleic acid-binding Zn-ribbon protein
MDGVSFIAIQALVKRTEELQKKNEMLMKKIETLEKDVALLKGQNATIINENTELKAELSGRIEAIEAELKKTKIGLK